MGTGSLWASASYGWEGCPLPGLTIGFTVRKARSHMKKPRKAGPQEVCATFYDITQQAGTTGVPGKSDVEQELML